MKTKPDWLKQVEFEAKLLEHLKFPDEPVKHKPKRDPEKELRNRMVIVTVIYSIIAIVSVIVFVIMAVSTAKMLEHMVSSLLMYCTVEDYLQLCETFKAVFVVGFGFATSQLVIWYLKYNHGRIDELESIVESEESSDDNS